MDSQASNQCPPSSFWIPISCSFTATFVDQATVAAPVCTGRTVVFQICNSNSVIDDNFDIYLNDIYIGKVNLNANALVGSVFIGDTDPAVTIGSSDFVCPIANMVVYRFSPSILKAYNTVRMVNTQNNGSGNLGDVGFRNYLKTGTSLSAPIVLANLQYSGNSGLSFNLPFEWTSCT
jgi:hypothetical protein